jgi:spermidine synthase
MSHITSFASGVSLTPSSSANILIKDGWFAETEAMWPGQKFCIQVEEVLLNGRSDFQDILVFKSSTYGTVLALGMSIKLS